jgi:biotin carboxyl carrier protein
MRRYQITIDGRDFDVRVLSDPRLEQVQVEVDGTPFTVDALPLPVHDEQPATSEPSGSQTSAIGSPAAPKAMLTAPLPGVIKSIAVGPGQQVAVGDELLVIEAMKMDNVIRAPRAGTIGPVHVAESHRIAHGEPMLEYLE